MKKCIALVTLFFLILPLGKVVLAQNPFISKPENRHIAPEPSAKNPVFVKIIICQHQLREKMSELVREAKSTKNLKPLLFLFVLAFTYGMVHAAGPGHGKLVAMSYLISCGRRYSRAILFGNLIAFFHGLSGVVFVLLVRLLLQHTVTGTLEETIRKTQLISFSLIFLLGLFLLIRSFFTWKKPAFDSDRYDFESKMMQMINNPFVMALAVGVVPCPGVVLVMLFCLSMQATVLGLALSFWIALGMAITITGVVLFGLIGKRLVLRLSIRQEKLALLAERIIETCAALAISALGLIFLMATY
ncbi:MAG: hypothetical protein ISS65_01035 [Desulfobacterales bacterium]|uniref:Nickel/cobalt efflux system n=1 Tax=Candidatus Desulfatibia profunda TaxID=2841695 RepID=A0A8J6NVS4_9BACT|nr:hypothetical protein [Candidatus Desulfatibia profunda]MBL7178782.1 hypothetical protein [Desulfobacterales bacterium]